MNRTTMARLLGVAALLAPLATQAQQNPADRFGNQQLQRQQEAARRRNPNSLTLQQAVDRALTQNLDIRRAENALAITQEDVFQTKLSYLPSLSASINYNRTFGTAFDQVSFARVERNTTNSSPQLFLSTTLFQGFARLYTLRQNIATREANELALIRQRNTTLQNVVLQYLQVIFDQSNIDISRTRIDLLRSQQQRQEALYKAGAAVRFDVLNVQSQVAVEEQNLITLINTLRTDKIRLLQTLQLEPLDSLDGGYDMVPIDTAFLAQQIGREMLPPVSSVEEAAFQTMPDLKEAQYRIDAARYSQKAAFAQFFPRLSLNAGWSSNFTTNDRLTDSIGTRFVPFVQFPTNAGGVPSISYLASQINGDFGYRGYMDQFRENQSEFIGVTLNIPLFNGWITQRNWRVARIQRNNAELDFEARKNQLTLQVRQAYFDVIAAREQQENLRRQAAALREAFTAAEAQFNAGLIDFTQYLQALNDRSRIEQQQFQSLYNYFLRSKVLDLFQGKPITF